MKNLQVSDNDLIGNRFNGHDLHLYLNERGIESKQIVRTKGSDDPNTIEIAENVSDRHYINWVMSQFEQKLLVQSLLYPLSYELLFNKYFLEADVVHYHLIHNYFFSIANFPVLTRLKPSVWTLHDPWAITGHCIHPFDCGRWQTGCGDCPRLDTEFVLKQDSTALNWELKRIYYHSSDLDIVVASKWMLDNAKQSPLLSKFRLHHIPFGIDLETFCPGDTKQAKRQLGIPTDTFVILFRGITWQLKGVHFIKSLLNRLDTERPICLLNVGSLDHNRENLDEFRGKFQILDLGWISDVEQLVRAYNAADVLVMPSLAEGFGMMAVEAMGCGRPVVVMDGTALPETVFAPTGGLSVPQGDVEALVDTTRRLMDSPEERYRLGQNARRLALKHYNVKDYVEKIIALYREVIERRKEETHRYGYLIAQLKRINLDRVSLFPDRVTGKPELPIAKQETETSWRGLSLVKSYIPPKLAKAIKDNRLLREIYFRIFVPLDQLVMKAYRRLSTKS
jgi:glycosyltransferase involved in cell wall biosynthesis